MVYVLRCGDGTLYTGVTNDLPRRLEAHRAGRGARYTRGRGPLQVVFVDVTENRSQAQVIEASIKRLPLVAKRQLVAFNSPR